MNVEPTTAAPQLASPRTGPSARLAGYLLPPYGIYLLWQQRASTLAAAFGTLGLLVYLVLYTGLGIALLKLTGKAEIDWRGYGRPRLVWSTGVRTSAAWQTSNTAIDTNSGAYWTDYRGPQRDGRYDETPIRTDWQQSPPRLLWKADLGGGHASMTIAQGRLFTMEQWAEGEAITAYNAADGKGLWKHLYPARFNDAYGMGGAGPRSTPTWHDGRVYALGAEGHLHCLDAADGRVVWQKNILEEHGTRNLMFGLCASPLVVSNAVIVTAGARAGAGRNTVIAYHKDTGAVLWAAAAENQAYMSPMRVTLAGTEQLLVTGARQLMGLSLTDGKPLWSLGWSVSYDNNIAQPLVVSTNRVFISAGYGKGCALVEIAAKDDPFTANKIWENKHLKNKFASSVLHEGHIYGLDDSGNDDAAHLVCLDASTGEPKWRADNYGHGQLLLASGHLLISCEDGNMALVKATPESHQLVARLPALDGKTWNNPALAGGKLYLRNGRMMACYDIRPDASAGTRGISTAGPEDLQVVLVAFVLMSVMGAALLVAITKLRRSQPSQ